MLIQSLRNAGISTIEAERLVTDLQRPGMYSLVLAEWLHARCVSRDAVGRIPRPAPRGDERRRLAERLRDAPLRQDAIPAGCRPGIITIEQNDIFKVLTIASVVGVPPTLMAGIWGMNFKFMPELGWTWGYPFTWTVIILSAVAPLLWFWRKGWF